MITWRHHYLGCIERVDLKIYDVYLLLEGLEIIQAFDYYRLRQLAGYG